MAMSFTAGALTPTPALDSRTEIERKPSVMARSQAVLLLRSGSETKSPIQRSQRANLSTILSGALVVCSIAGGFRSGSRCGLRGEVRDAEAIEACTGLGKGRGVRVWGIGMGCQ